MNYIFFLCINAFFALSLLSKNSNFVLSSNDIYVASDMNFQKESFLMVSDSECVLKSLHAFCEKQNLYEFRCMALSDSDGYIKEIFASVRPKYLILLLLNDEPLEHNLFRSLELWVGLLRYSVISNLKKVILLLPYSIYYKNNFKVPFQEDLLLKRRDNLVVNLSSILLKEVYSLSLQFCNRFIVGIYPLLFGISCDKCDPFTNISKYYLKYKPENKLMNQEFLFIEDLFGASFFLLNRFNNFLINIGSCQSIDLSLFNDKLKRSFDDKAVYLDSFKIHNMGWSHKVHALNWINKQEKS